MKIVRKIISTILFTIAGIALANLVISLPKFNSFDGFIFSFLIYGTISFLFGLGAILLWNKSVWKRLMRNFLVSVGGFSLLISIFSPFITEWVFKNYESPELQSFNSLWWSALIGACILFLVAYAMNSFFINSKKSNN